VVASPEERGNEFFWDGESIKKTSLQPFCQLVENTETTVDEKEEILGRSQILGVSILVVDHLYH
jgi:hypothetical protein